MIECLVETDARMMDDRGEIARNSFRKVEGRK